LRKDGYTRAKIDGEIKDLEEVFVLDKRKKHNIDVIIDRLVIKEGILRRLTDSLEAAARLSGGLVKIEVVGGKDFLFNEKLSCVECGVSYPEINPTTFSFNSPFGACAECKGLGVKFYFDPEYVVPDASLSINEGAIAPWSRSGGKKAAGWYLNMLSSLAKHYRFSLDMPFKKLSGQVRETILNGSGEEEIEFLHEGERSKYAYTGRSRGIEEP
jgi:excinuclease ABC subunit A